MTLNRPEVLNAFNEAMQSEFVRLWEQVKADDDVRAVVLAAAGDRAFSTGIDVTERLDSESPFVDREHPWAENEDPGHKLSPRRHEVWKPVIAAVHGMCAGGAFYWIADCDIVICSPEATFFDPHVTYGFIAALEPIAMSYRMPFSEVMRMSLLGLHERHRRGAGAADRPGHRDRRTRRRWSRGPRSWPRLIAEPAARRGAGHGQGAVAVPSTSPGRRRWRAR